MESEARKDFDEALAIRKSCLQILIVIVEFLSNANIRGGMIVIQAKAKEQAQEAAEGKSPTRGSIQQVIPTSISAQDHKKLTNLIYNKYDLLDLIYKQVIMRIIEPNNTADKEKNKSRIMDEDSELDSSFDSLSEDDEDDSDEEDFVTFTEFKEYKDE